MNKTEKSCRYEISDQKKVEGIRTCNKINNKQTNKKNKKEAKHLYNFFFQPKVKTKSKNYPSR